MGQDQDTTAPDSTTDEAPPVGATPSVPGTPAGVDWKKRQADTRRALDLKTEETRVLQGKLDTTTTELETVKAELAKLKGQLTKTTKAQTALSEGHTTLQKEHDWLMVLTGQYPDLVAYAFPKDGEGNSIPGLIRQDLEGDELITHLDHLRGTLGKLQHSAVQEHVQGASAPSQSPSGHQATMTKKQVLFELSGENVPDARVTELTELLYSFEDE